MNEKHVLTDRQVDYLMLIGKINELGMSISLSRAAERLAVSRQAVSQMRSRLKEIGYIEYSGKGMSTFLTKKGENFFKNYVDNRQ